MKHIPFAIAILTLFFLANPLRAETMFETPRDALDTYLSACERGDQKAAVQCYTASSRKLVEMSGLLDDSDASARLKALYERLQTVEFREEKYSDTRAAMWPDDETIPPFLFRIQDREEGWRMDYHFMSHYIQADEDGWSWRNKRLFEIWKTRK